MRRCATAVLVAGGKGLRFGGSVRKQYLKLNGRPLLRWSVAAFDQSPSIAELIIVAPEDDLGALRRMISRWRVQKPITVVAGGETRADSVRFGLAALSTACKWVAVHDAVRPLVTVDLIEQTLREAQKTGAAIAACPSKDTVKISDKKKHVQSTPDRDTVWLAQTPQIFERRLLERAHAMGRDRIVTDDAQLVEQLGKRVSLVRSPPENLKVTHPLDLVLARAVIASTRRVRGARFSQ